jgi:hypothetical protein
VTQTPTSSVLGRRGDLDEIETFLDSVAAGDSRVTGAQVIAQNEATAKAANAAKYAAYGAAWERRYRAERGAGYVSPHDKVVLKAAKDWEIRYRAMYPNS